MNGNGSGIVPTVDLATNNYPYPMMGGYGYGNGFFGGDGIWALILIAILFGNGGWGFSNNNNGLNNLVTTEDMNSNFLQRDVNGGFQNTNNLISNGFADAAQNLCNVRSDVLTGNMALNSSILENRYLSQLSECNTQRDILQQTNEINTNLLTQALQNQAHVDSCCCDIKELIRQDGAETRALITQNTIDSLREKLNNAETVISNQQISENIINSVRPYPVPAYLTGSPYMGYGFGFNNGFWGNGFNYGNGFFGNTIV